jgi:hypothetical protein
VDITDVKLVRDQLQAAADDRDPKVREEASKSLRYLDNSGKTAVLYPDAVKRALTGFDGNLREIKGTNAVSRLAVIRGNPGDESSEPRLVAPLCELVASDPDEKVRLAAARVVFWPGAGAMIDPAVAASALKALKEDQVEEIRSAAR